MSKKELYLQEAVDLVGRLEKIFPFGFAAGDFALDLWKGESPKSIDFFVPSLTNNDYYYDDKFFMSQNQCKLVLEQEFNNDITKNVKIRKIDRFSRNYESGYIHSVDFFRICGWRVQIIQWKAPSDQFFQNHVLDRLPISIQSIGFSNNKYVVSDRFIDSIYKKEIGVVSDFFGKYDFKRIYFINQQAEKFPHFNINYEPIHNLDALIKRKNIKKKINNDIIEYKKTKTNITI